MMFGNVGNMGVPLSLFAFGEAGLSLAVVVFATHSIIQFTFGISLAAGRANFGQLVRIPVIYGVVFALPFLVTGARPPVWLDNTVSVLGSLVIPLMLLTMGVALSRLRVDRLGRSAFIATFRLVAGFAIGIILAEVFGFEGAVRGVFIIMSAMPIAVFNFIFAERYKREPEEVAAAIVISTVISFATLPFLLLLVL